MLEHLEQLVQLTFSKHLLSCDGAESSQWLLSKFLRRSPLLSHRCSLEPDLSISSNQRLSGHR